MKKGLRLPSPALVISLVALFVALGGTGYAALHLPQNSVGPIQIRNGAVIGVKIRDGAVTGAKIRNGAVTAGKINPKGLTVPNATHATIALTAQTAATAATATTATTATSAATAASASSPGSLASGKTEAGVYDVRFVASTVGDVGSAAITFPFPLAAPVTNVEWIQAGGPPDANCPGSAASPKAAAGYLCLYANSEQNVASRCVEDTSGACTNTASAYGAVARVTAVLAQPTASSGTWAVTAP